MQRISSKYVQRNRKRPAQRCPPTDPDDDNEVGVSFEYAMNNFEFM